jgi:DNA-3-methyladenine glycosylase
MSEQPLAVFPFDFFLRPTLVVARGVLGALVEHAGRVGRIVETEAYLFNDPACHAVRDTPAGPVHRHTARNAAMFGPPGRAYVYFTYGNHFMLNIVTAAEGTPEAVLIRALEPLEGLDAMLAARGIADPRGLTNGPGKLTQALGITGALNGHDLAQPPLRLLQGTPVADADIVAAPRIGITRATDCLYRFYERGQAWVSRR